MPTWDPRANDLFLKALELHSAHERWKFLDEECFDDVALRAEVVALLDASARAGRFLESPVSGPALPHTIDEPNSERPGTSIGPYKLLEQIGDGGFGIVFMAEQHEPVRRKVALKVLKPGMDTRQVVARFEAERQALAIMDHPNIARVFDGGVSPSGRPFFVMELVKGTPITSYCDDNHLTPRQRLELCVPVCQAVQHAHQKGIIHRDLKPSNVLVAVHDAMPVVKVIDFGVAKAVGQELTDKTVFTGFAQMIGTPLYMSPEQAGQSSLDIDTRSDIYSLGVLLYELLTGTTPIDRERFKKAAYDEIRRIIREEEPPKPSSRLSESKHSLPSISALRRTEPKKLTNQVRGELDWIVMKCLEKDRNRRYETANGLAMDLQRYLSDEPVVAGPPSAMYRMRKFVRRNKGLVVAASIIVFCLLAGILGTSAGMIWATQERDEKARALAAETAAKDAEAEARQAQKQAFDRTRTALVDLTDYVVENQMARGSTLNEEDKEFLRKIIKHFEALATVTADDAESRAIRAEGYARVGKMRHRLGELKDAETAYADALAIRKQLAAEFPARPEFREDLATSHNNLGFLFYTTGRLKEAEAAYANALAIRKQLAAKFPTRPEFRKSLAGSHNNLGALLIDIGRLKDAEAAYADALAIQKQLAADLPARPEFRKDLAKSHNSLGVLLHGTGRVKEAEAAFADALAIKKQLAADFPTRSDFREDLATSHINLGVLFYTSGRLKEAEAAYADALSILKDLAAEFPARPEYRQKLAGSQNNLGTLLVDTGRLKEAEAAYADALAIKKQLAADFPNQPDRRNDVANTLVNLAVLCNQRRDFYAAKRYLAEAEVYHLAALKANPRHPTYHQFYRNNLWALARANAGLLAQPAAVRAAERIRDLGWDPPGNAYDAASALARCMPIVEKHEQLDDETRRAAVRFYGDEAMRMLKDAVAKGYKDAKRMQQDKDLDPLRERDDFKKLIKELTKKDYPGAARVLHSETKCGSLPIVWRCRLKGVGVP